MKPHVSVLGAGMAGLAAGQRAAQLGCEVEVFEKNSYSGGHTYSHEIDGFIFDEGPHISFTKRPEIKELLANAVNGEFLEQDSLISNNWRGQWIKHPAQCNLHGLPTDVVERCIVDFAKARFEPEREINTYADWCHQGLGEAFSQEFTFPYTRKYWTTEAANMSTDWVGDRMYPPKLEEVVRGALNAETENFHYLNSFRYPTRGGFNSYVPAVEVKGQVKTDFELATIDLKRREMEFCNGQKIGFEALISSLPVPELIKRVKDVPSEVREAAQRLVCTSVVVVNVGLKRDQGFPDAHWMYFYDEDISFARANLPHRLSPNNVPDGCGSVQVEVYHSKYKPLPQKDTLNRVLDDLKRVGLVLEDDEILVANAQHIAYANVLFDLERARSLGIVQSYLDEQNVACCGRYGEWAYYWTDDSIVSGWRAADKVCASA